MKCSNCGSFLPPNSPICPFCGTKIEQTEIEKINQTETEKIEKSETEILKYEEVNKDEKNLEKPQEKIEKNVFNLPSLKWLEFSLNFIANNIRDIVILGIINNPLFYLISLGMVSFFYNSYLYQFCIAFKKNEIKIPFDYKKNFKIGFQITYLNFVVFLPFLFLFLIPLIFLIIIGKDVSRNPNPGLILIFIFLYLIIIVSLSTLPIIFTLIRNYIVLELVDYEERQWNFFEIIKKTYKRMFKYWLTFIIIFSLILVIYYSLYNAFTILCYCTLGLMLLFISIPYVMIDILILGYMMNEKIEKEGSVNKNV